MNQVDQHIEALADRVSQSADEIESERQLPQSLATALKQAGMFTLLMPESIGGRQTSFPEFVNIVQRFGEADGSTGWSVNQGSVLGTMAHQFAPEAAKKIWSGSTITLANGPPIGAESIPVDGGIELSGKWVFSSGINHADWLVGISTLRQADKPAQTIWAFFPKNHATIDPKWDVNGLIGTGSYNFSVDKLFVPAECTLRMSPQPDAPLLYQFPMNLLFASGFAAVALGVSRAALDFAIERAATKVKRFQKDTMSHDPIVQSALGETYAEWCALDSLLHQAVEQTWDEMGSQKHPQLTDTQRMRIRLAATHTIRRAKQVADRAYDLCSTDSIFRNNGIQRRFQDIHVISQHLQGRPENYETVGRYLMGLDFDRAMIS